MNLSVLPVQCFPLPHWLACPSDGGIDKGIGVRMKGWYKNVEAESGETIGVNGNHLHFLLALLLHSYLDAK